MLPSPESFRRWLCVWHWVVGRTLFGRRGTWIQLIVAVGGLGRAQAAEPGTTAATAPLTTLRQVRELSPGRAEVEASVLVEGVLTYVDHPRYMCFLQDSTAGIYLLMENDRKFEAGQRVRVEGITANGRFTPFLRIREVTVLGRAPLPPARVVGLDEFRAGFLEGERVAVEGRVQTAQTVDNRLRLKLAHAGETFIGWIGPSTNLPTNRLAGARVRLSGVCAGVFNDRDEIVDFHLHAVDANSLELLDPPGESPAPLATDPIKSLERNWPQDAAHRVRCRGVVTLHWPGRYLFITDGSSTIELRSDEAPAVVPGDVVEVTGLRTVAHRRMILTECVIEKQGSGAPPTPSRTDLRQIHSRHSHGELVELELEVLDRIELHPIEDALAQFETPTAGPQVLLRWKDWSLGAELDPNAPGSDLSFLTPRSWVRVTGVVAAQPVATGEPLNYRLLVRSARDFRVIRAASWWTVQRVVYGLLAVTVVALSMLGWIVGLSQRRRRKAEEAVRRQQEKATRHRDALLELTREVQSGQEAETIRRATELVSRVLGERRVGVWRLEQSGTELLCLDLLADGAHRAGDRIRVTDFPAYFSALKECRTIAAEDAQNDPRTLELSASYLQPLDIRSMLDVPLRFHGQPSGVLCIEHVGEARPWEIEEQNFAAAVADQLTILHESIERRRAERSLREAHSDLEMRVMIRTTELAEARDRAEAADRLKSAFLATMSHELRTPLNSIIGFTGILLQGLVGPMTPEQRKQLGMVQNSARHLLSLINDVLDISKIEAGQVELRLASFEIPEAVQRVVELVTPLAERKSLPIKTRFEPNLGTLVSDRRRVEQILINLLNNAIKFTERGEIRLEAERQEDAVEFRIIDTGMGIRDEDLPRLFRPFQQLDTGLSRHHEGTGLGLAICSGLVRLLRGTLRVQSEFGQGSTFSVKFPLREPLPVQ